MEEFFRQGDCERSLHLPISFLCDRHTIQIPLAQQGWGCPETLHSQCCGHMTGALYLKLLKLSIHSLGNTCKRIEVSPVSAKCFPNAIHSALAYICIIPQGSGCRGKVFCSGRLSILIAQWHTLACLSLPSPLPQTSSSLWDTPSLLSGTSSASRACPTTSSTT